MTEIPDFDDYTWAAESAVRMAGLENLQDGEIYWDPEQAYSSALPEGRTGAIGFDADGKFSDIDTEYLPEELAERVAKHSGSRELSIRTYSNWSSRSQCGEENQYVSVELNEAERNAVIDYLDSQEPEEFNADLVSYWERGKPKEADETFGFVSVQKEWERVADAVRQRAPEAAHALETAEDLRRTANSSFEGEVEHMHTDEWKREQAGISEPSGTVDAQQVALNQITTTQPGTVGPGLS